MRLGYGDFAHEELTGDGAPARLETLPKLLSGCKSIDETRL
jgi:hypothetical protein